MTTYACIALDMDGTLLNRHEQISAVNKTWIKRAEEQGVTVCLATGRGRQSVWRYVEELQLTSPVILVNGSEVWADSQTLIKRHEMSAETIIDLWEIAKQYGCWFWAYSTEGIYNEAEWLDDPGSKTWLKFGFQSDQPEIIDTIRQQLERTGQFQITNSHPSNIELNPRGVSKASGLREICRLLSIRMADIVAVGDSMNDLAMIQEAGLGVAMGNAQEEIKHAADWVTLTNDEDGVAHVIREKVLNE